MLEARTTYVYDVTGRMTQVTIDSNGDGTIDSSVTYAYDANGFRVERTEAGQTTVYLVDPANPTGYAQVLAEGVDANGNHALDASEVQEAFVLRMRVLTQATATQALRLLGDAHGSTRAALDAAAGATAAAVLQNYAYSAYGQDLSLTN